MKKGKEKINWTSIGWFAFSLLWITKGIIFVIEDKSIIGLHRDTSINVVGGWLIILVGIIFLYVSYYTLSPFGSIRGFFGGRKKSKKN